MWEVDFDNLKHELMHTQYDQVRRVAIEEMFMDLNSYYKNNNIPFDNFYYEHNDKLMIYILDNIGFYDVTIAASSTDNYEKIYSHVMHNSNRTDTALTLLSILSEQSPSEFEKYQAALLDRLLSLDLNSNNTPVSHTPLGMLGLLFIYIYGRCECFESDVKIVNSAIKYGVFDGFINNVLEQHQYPHLTSRLMNALPAEDKYDLYKLGVNI